MKFTIFILFISLLQANASGFAQKVNLNLQNVPIEKVFQFIKEQTGYAFVYNSQYLEKANVSIQLKNGSIEQALNACLKDFSVTYRIIENNILIKDKEKVAFDPIGSIQGIIEVKGSVLDQEGKPLPYATVKVKGSYKVTSTNGEGYFVLKNVDEKATLIFSFLGFINQEVSVNGRSSINVTLAENKSVLEEVAVTALGVSKEKRSLSYAITTLKSDDLMKAGIDNLGSGLIGKVAGLQVANTSGGPMAGTRINLRGINTIDGNQRPLIILNGIPYSEDVSAGGNNFGEDSYANRGFGNGAKGSLLNNINPDDIESISVLKGANAAALYGSQAMGGVIIINTKQGNGNKKGLGVEVYSDYTLNQNAYFTPRQNEFGNGAAPHFTSFSATDPTLPTWPSTSSLNFGPKLDGRPIQWWDGVVRPWVAQPDNFKDLFQNGYTNNNNVSLSGGLDKGGVRFSATNFNYGGFLPNMKQQRNSANLGVNYQISPKISVKSTVSFTQTSTQNPPERLDRGSNFPMPINEIIDLYSSNYKNPLGYYLTDQIKTISSNLKDNIILPLLWDQRENRSLNEQQQLMASFSMNYQIIEPLSFNFTGGTNRYFQLGKNKQPWMNPSDPTNTADRQGGYNEAQTTQSRNYFQGLLTFSKPLNDDFKLSASAGGSLDHQSFESISTTVAGLRINKIYSFANNKGGAVINPSGSQGEEQYVALFGAAELDYKNYLYLNLTGRNDWSSKLNSNNRSYFYPSVGLSFILSEVVKLPEVINYAKLRSSYAIVGNTVPSRYFISTNYPFGNYQMANGTNVITSSIPNSITPTDVLPEKSYSTEFGMETALFDSRLTFDLTYYYNKTKNLIASVPVANSSSVNQINVNAGSLENRGFEWQIGAKVIKSKDFNWSMTLNGNVLKRKVLSLGPGLTTRTLGNPFNATFKANTGEEPYSIYMNKVLRNEAGLPIVDVNGFIQWEPTLSNLGQGLPKSFGGFSNTFNYKNLSSSASLDYSWGGKIVSYTNLYIMSSGVSPESLKYRDTEHGGLTYYTNAGVNVLLPTGQTAPVGLLARTDGLIISGVQADGSANTTVISAVNYYNNTYGQTGIEQAVFKNNYIRLGELVLSYKLPDKVAGLISMSGVTVSIIGRNLAYLYKTLPNISPGNLQGTNSINSAFEYTSYPTTRNYGFSVKANF